MEATDDDGDQEHHDANYSEKGEAGQGIVATTMMIYGGFMVLALFGFAPLVRFGLLTTVAVLAALAMDAVLLPVQAGEGSGRRAPARVSRPSEIA